MKKNKSILWILVGIIVFGVFISIIGAENTVESESGISALFEEDLSDEKFYVGVNHGSYELDVISSKEYDESAIRVVIDDPSIINVTYDYADDWLFTGIKFYINCLKSGTTSFYFETIDSVIKSDPIEITVNENVTSITLSRTDDITFYSWQDDETISFDYEALHTLSEINNVLVFVSENPNVATFEYDKDGSWLTDYCVINAVSSGETYVYIQTKDGSVQSQKLKVIIPEAETETETEADYDTNYDAEEETQNNSVTVYITPTGKKYHYSKSCAGKNASPISLDDAELSYDPCKKCAH